MTLDKLKPGEKATVIGIGGKGPVRRRLIDMGITPGANVMIKKTAPFGDPLEVNIRGYSLSMRRSEASQVTVERND
jgi:ferrous iron transport protein A